MSLARLKFEALAEPAYNGLENLAVRMKFPLLGFGLQFGVQLQKFGVRNALAVGGENGAQRRKDSCLPVNEGAVAIEADNRYWEKSSTNLSSYKVQPTTCAVG